MRHHNTNRVAQTPREVFEVLSEATYIVIFAIPDPDSLSVPTTLVPSLPLITNMAVKEAPRRFSSTVLPPTPQGGFRTSKVVGSKQVAKQHFELDMMPNFYQAAPDRTPPLTLLLPFLSQRAWLHDGHFNFLDGQGSAFRLQAGARFWPAPKGLGVWIGGVADILEGEGQLQGFTGNVAINGLTTPPTKFANVFTFRLVDPEGKLKVQSLPPVAPEIPDPDYSDSSVIPLLAELDADHAMEIEPLPDSSKKRVHLVERLRLVDTNFDVSQQGLQSHNVFGEEVGERHTTLVFDPDSDLDPIPMYTENSEFRFFADSKLIGTLKADLFEGRCFKTTAPELANPYFRYGGFGLFGEGTGQFVGVEGLLTLIGAISLEPGALSSMYMVRILDPDGVFRAYAERSP